MTHKEQKIIVTIGPAGCGKSTWASQYVNSHENTIIVSRDAIRKLLYGFDDSNLSNYYETDTKTREAEVSAFSDALIRKALRDGKNVIADNTHLRQSYINVYKNYGVKIELHWFSVKEDVLYNRNIARVKSVHVSVLEKQIESFKSLYDSAHKINDDIRSFNEYLDVLYDNSIKLPLSFKKRNAYIFDIDGTLSHVVDRSAYDYSKVGDDRLDVYVALLLTHLKDNRNIKVFIVSGRDEECFEETKKWLQLNDISFDGLYMRKHNDNRKDWIVKAEIWAKIQKDHNILGMIDDRSQVVDFARRLNYKVFQVESGEF